MEMANTYHHPARIVFVLLFSVIDVVSAQGFQRAPLPKDHPLIGRWRIELPQFKCFEEYEVRGDGTRSAIAGQERNESEFVISWTPSAKGYYKWVDRIVRNNGKPDCTGALTPLGDVATNYILLHPDGNRFLLCQAEDVNSCIGPYVRKKAE